jgi:transcriptional regulator with XRE-family HTH domain
MPRQPLVTVDPDFPDALRRLRERRGLSTRAVRIVSASYISQMEHGLKTPTVEMATALDRLLNADGELAAMVRPGRPDAPVEGTMDDEIEAVELARRVTASDIGDETIGRLEAVVDELATRYSVTPPQDLLGRARRYLNYTTGLLDANKRKTLDEHRRLIEVCGWLSLLAATLHIDLKQGSAAAARLATAATLSRHAGQREILAWTFETQAWAVITEGDYRRALELSQTAQEIAPPGGSVIIQATAQEGRAWARLGQARETYAALDRVARMTANLERPDRPEHHYHYDPDKAVAYIATTLAWLGDPAAEGYAREVIVRLKAAEDAGGWPRRVAAAQIDLALALIAAGKLDEAAATAQTAILSGRIVPSNHWRAREIVHAVESRDLPEAPDLREAYELLRRGGIPAPAALPVVDRRIG